jgi:hypothetical protein
MNPRPYHRPAWATRPAVVIASGPSLSDEQLQLIEQAHLEERVHVIAVNNTIQRAPWADVCYFGDYTALKHYLPKLKPLTLAEWVTIDRSAHERWRLTHVKPATSNGMSLDRIHMNANSGAQAVNLAAAFGAQRILLVGFDMRNAADGRAHWFGQHPQPLVTTQLFPDWLYKFAYIAEAAKKLGIELVNCTPGSALTCVPVGDLEECLRG